MDNFKLDEQKYGKWKKTGLLQDLEEKESKILAAVLESQAHQILKEKEFYNKDVGSFQLPVISRVMRDLFKLQKEKKFEIVPMLMPASALCHKEEDEEGVYIVANTRQLRTKLLPRSSSDLACLNMDEEVERIKNFSESLFEEIKEEILQDISDLEEGKQYFYCPYIFLCSTPRLAFDDTQRFMIRYAKKVI